MLMGKRGWLIICGITVLAGGLALAELLAHEAIGEALILSHYTRRYILLMIACSLAVVVTSSLLIWRAFQARGPRFAPTWIAVLFLLGQIGALTAVWVLLPQIAHSLILNQNVLLRPSLTWMIGVMLLALPKPKEQLWQWSTNIAAALSILGAVSSLGVLYYQHEVLCAPHPWEWEYRVNDWPQWHADPAHSGYLGGHGAIDEPTVAWRYFLGGTPDSAFAVHDGNERLIVLTGGGRAVAYTQAGEIQWQAETFATSSILGVWEMNRDDVPEIVVLDSDLRRGAVQILNARNGEEIFRTEPVRGRTGSVMVADLTGDGLLELIWSPAAASTIYVYTLADTPRLLWDASLESYVSDPYTFSSIAVGDVNADGNPEVVVAGARHQSVVIVLSHMGEELGRLNYGSGVEAGGTRHLIWIGPLNDLPGDDILIVGGWPVERYMFQGIAEIHVGSDNSLHLDQEINLSPFGPRYVYRSLIDLDSNGSYELIFTRPDPDSGSDDIIVMDLATGETRAEIPNLTLLGIFPSRDNLAPPLLVTQGPTGLLQVLSIEPDGTSHTLWEVSDRDVIVSNVPTILPPYAMYYDPILPTLDANGDGVDEILVLSHLAGQQWRLEALDIQSGAQVTEFTFHGEPRPHVLLAEESGVVVATPDGRVVLLDSQLNVYASVEFGTYYRRLSPARLEGEVAAIADIGGEGEMSVLVVDAQGRLLRLDQGQATELTSSSAQNPELLAADLDHDGAFEIIVNADCTIGAHDGEGTMIWETRFEDCAGWPYGMNVGDLNSDGILDVVAFVPMPLSQHGFLSALNGQDGQLLWETTHLGPAFWGYVGKSVATVGFLDRDSVVDITFSSNNHKGSVLGGSDGDILAEPAWLPNYAHLGPVDYSGIVILLDADGDGETELLNACDDAHLALLELHLCSANTLRTAWRVPQAALDDELLSTPAVVPGARARQPATVGLGSAGGIFRVRNAATGDLLWAVGLADGQVHPGEREQDNALGGTAAADINGDGIMEFVVGGTDGWLYALRATDGTLVWAYQLGSLVGDPILGDIDNDGLLEIVVAAADGYLYALDD